MSFIAPKQHEGIGTLVLRADSLPQSLLCLPISYRVLRSMPSEVHGIVRLEVASTDIAGNDVSLEIQTFDAGSTKTVRIVPITITGE